MPGVPTSFVWKLSRIADTNGYAISPIITARHGNKNSQALSQSRPNARRRLVDSSTLGTVAVAGADRAELTA